jgi:hypothetical protein
MNQNRKTKIVQFDQFFPVEGFSDGFIFTTRGSSIKVTPGLSTTFEDEHESATIVLTSRTRSQ